MKIFKAGKGSSTLIRQITVLVITAILFSCSGGRESLDEPVIDRPQPLTKGISPMGRVDTTRPRFSWPALDGASEYHLIVEDDSGNHFKQTVFPADAGCMDTTAACEATPAVSYLNESINWRVDAVVAGKVVPLTGPENFITPADTAIQPVTDNAAVCDVWPALMYDRFAVLNNIWNAGTVHGDNWSQTISAEQLTNNNVVASWSYNWLDESKGVPHAVKAYPEVIFGNKLGTLISGNKEDTGLPERIDKLASYSIGYRYSETGSAERNVAIESFFHDSCDVTGPCHLNDNRAYEMMVWINNPKKWRPGDLALSDVVIDGLAWDIYIKPRSNKRYIAFAAKTPQTEGKINWNRFVDWTVTWTTANAKELGISPMTADLCMGAIEFGTEIWSGSGSFTLEQFEVTRN